MRRLIRIILASAALLIGGAASAAACEFAFVLTSPDGGGQNVTPGGSTPLVQGETYTLTVEFTEDHGNCKLEPDDTVFLLEEEKWKTTKDHLPLRLLSGISWVEDTSRVNTAQISFEAVKAGSWEMEVIRECSKGGYDEVLTFVVTET